MRVRSAARATPLVANRHAIRHHPHPQVRRLRESADGMHLPISKDAIVWVRFRIFPCRPGDVPAAAENGDRLHEQPTSPLRIRSRAGAMRAPRRDVGGCTSSTRSRPFRSPHWHASRFGAADRTRRISIPRLPAIRGGVDASPQKTAMGSQTGQHPRPAPNSAPARCGLRGRMLADVHHPPDRVRSIRRIVLQPAWEQRTRTIRPRGCGSRTRGRRSRGRAGGWQAPAARRRTPADAIPAPAPAPPREASPRPRRTAR